MFNASHSYVKNICLSIHIKCIIETQFIDGAGDLREMQSSEEQD